jgi:hypothetical protein
MSKSSKEYRTWQRMIARCHDEDHERYHWYGARGIAVCDEWREDFHKFLDHVGRAPTEDHTIDRIENDGNYEPGNVKWSTWREQAQNRRGNVTLTHKGLTLVLAEWARRKNMDRRILWKRLNLFGWEVAEAIDTPVAARKKAA